MGAKGLSVQDVLCKLVNRPQGMKVDMVIEKGIARNCVAHLVLEGGDVNLKIQAKEQGVEQGKGGIFYGTLALPDPLQADLMAVKDDG